MFKALKAKLFPPIIKLCFNDGRIRYAPLQQIHDVWSAGGYILEDDNKVRDPNDLCISWEYVKPDAPPPRKPRPAPKRRIRKDLEETIWILRTQTRPTLSNPTTATDLADRLEIYLASLKD